MHADTMLTAVNALKPDVTILEDSSKRAENDPDARFEDRAAHSVIRIREGRRTAGKFRRGWSRRTEYD